MSDRAADMVEPTRVVVVGTVALNGGDAALLAAQIQVVRSALGEVEVSVFDFQGESTARRYQDLDIHPSFVSTHGAAGLADRGALIIGWLECWLRRSS